MKIINFSETDSVINRYLAEIRDADYQKNRLLFRNNITRIGEMMAYEMSKTLTYEEREVTTPLGTARIRLPQDSIVLSTIFRAGLPLHAGFPNVFDHADNGFVSAYRKYTDEAHTEVGIEVEYLATPNLDGKTLIIADPMLATGGSIEMGYRAFDQRYAAPRRHSLCAGHTRRTGTREEDHARRHYHRMVCRHRRTSQRAQVHHPRFG